MNNRRDVIFYCAFVVLTFASVVPLVMRGQHQAPKLKSETWPKLVASKAKCGIDHQKWNMRCDIAYTPEVKAMDGKVVSLDGFILPLESTATFHHFLLSVRAPSCPYCPPGGPNEMAEVFSTTPMKWSEQSVSMRGTLKLTEPHNETGIFYQLMDADNDVSYESTSDSAVQAVAPAKALGEYSFSELKESGQQDISIKQWAGKPLLVAFWRSDCLPCLKEMEVFPKIVAQHAALPIALVSLQDAEHTLAHLPPMPANVHILVAQDDGRELLTAFGNDRMMALPYSVMLDASGKLCKKQNGIVTPDTITTWLKQCSLAH